ncbi:DUF2568 domain-containing protein [Deinococcus soli (ex Cha et al. 2016)]|uniref:DUF2568 domain-containing protein n=1 Tax=Deinococcus soli (ex Cha et al. 2016) TaxID=1309411 RepID=UPI001669D851|nr:DUF2568 domain-containing protein [Deinococcus soli (ex Cha et al. 2016)]
MKANSVQLVSPDRVSAADLLALTTEPAVLATATTFAAVWGTFLSPRAPRPARGAAWPALKLAVFSLAALALAAVAGPPPAAVFLCAPLLSTVHGGAR